MNIKERLKQSQLAMDSMKSTDGLRVSDSRTFKMSFIDDDGKNQARFIAKDKAELYQMASKIIAMDSADANFNTPSNGVPAMFTIAWSNEIIRQVTQEFAYKKIADDYQQGGFETNSINFPTLAHSGEVADYGDNVNDGETNLNYNVETIDVIRVQVPVSYGDLEVATFGAAKVDAIAEKREAGAIAMAQKANDIFFNGVAGKRIYGMLNHPNLSPAIALPVGASASAKWSTKTPEEINNDILIMFNDIVVRASNNLTIGDVTQEMILALTPEDMTYLLRRNSFGRTPLEYINSSFPGLRIEPAIQYRVGNGSAGNKAQLIINKIANQKVVRNAFTYQLMAHRLVAMMSSYNQKFSAGFAGCALTVPIGVSTATGV